MARWARKGSNTHELEQKMAKEDVLGARDPFYWTKISTNPKLTKPSLSIQTLLDIHRYNSNYRSFQTCAAEVD